MTKILLTFFLLLSFSFGHSAVAEEIITLPIVNFNLTSSNVLINLENTFANPERMLKRYYPTGAKIEKMSVDHNQFQFYATKRVMLISKTVFVHGNFDMQSNVPGCRSKSEKGFLAIMDFTGSDDLLIDNIEKFEALICVQEKSSTSLDISVTGRLYKGNNFMPLIASIVTDLISAQTDPLIKAISEEVKSAVH
ncbi:MAG: hypothetical protein Q7U04_00315 [Bacteriovorax sp.]|nr:hypothetical protein [Bacteriovorax sp.]